MSTKHILTEGRALRVLPLVFLLTFGAHAQSQGWKQYPLLGIGNYKLGMDQRSKTIFGAGDGTLIRSTDLGHSWTYHPIGTAMKNIALYIHSIDTVCLIPDCIFLFSGDGGKSFTSRKSSLFAFYTFNEERISTYGSQRDLWYVNPSIFRTSDFGETWHIRSDRSSAPHQFQAAFANPYDSLFCIAVSEGYPVAKFVYRSTDGGSSWKNPRDNIIYQPKGRICWAFTQSGNLYLNDCVVMDSGKSVRMYHRDPYHEWMLPLDEVVHQVVYNPNDSCIYAANEMGLLKLRDGSNELRFTETLRYKADTNGFAIGPVNMNVRNLLLDTTDNIFYVHIRDSLFVGRDPDFEVRQTANARNVISIFGLSGSSDTILTFTDDYAQGLHRSTNSGATWEPTLGRVSYSWSSPTRFWQSPRFPNLVIHGNKIYGGAANYDMPHYSTDGGASWNEAVSSGSAEDSWVYALPRSDAGIHHDPFHPEMIYGISGFLFWRQVDTVLLNGPPFTILDSLYTDEIGFEIFLRGSDDPHMPRISYTDIEFDPNREGVVYCIGQDRTSARAMIYRSEEYFTQWESIFPYALDETPRRITVNPANTDDILVMFTRSGFIRTTDGGTLWEGVNQSFTGWPKCVVRDPVHPDYLYAGMRSHETNYLPPEGGYRGGVYESTNGGSTWQRLTDDGLFNWNINDIQLLQEPRQLLIATDCGAYSLSLPDVEVPVEEPFPVKGFALNECYPNPVSAGQSASISYSLPIQNHISLEVYNMLGQKIHTLYNGIREPGNHTTRLNASALPPGVYRIMLHTGAGVKSQMVIIR